MVLQRVSPRTLLKLPLYFLIQEFFYPDMPGWGKQME